jgi:hypothetical protein
MNEENYESLLQAVFALRASLRIWKERPPMATAATAYVIEGPNVQ